MTFWLRNGLLGWVVLSAVWGVLTVVYDVVILCTTGVEDTISWQTQQASVEWPVIPALLGLVVGGLTVHFFLVTAWRWYRPGQPWMYWLLGFALGATLVAFTWTQRG